RQVVLVEPAWSDALDRLRGLAREPEHLRDRIADAAKLLDPFVELLPPLGERETQPVRVVGQIERARAARDRRAMSDRGQEFALLQRIDELRSRLGELRAERVQV